MGVVKSTRIGLLDSIKEMEFTLMLLLLSVYSLLFSHRMIEGGWFFGFALPSPDGYIKKRMGPALARRITPQDTFLYPRR